MGSDHPPFSLCADYAEFWVTALGLADSPRRLRLLEIPLAYWLAIHRQMQSKGAFWVIVIAEGAIAAASAILFKPGRWKKQKI